ncbi:allantoicase [Diutina catenulata]
MSCKRVSIEEFQKKVVNQYTNVIGSAVGGKVLDCSDEFFAEAANLIKPGKAVQDLTKFVPTGKWFDGWETRRHNTAGADWVTFKMGVASAQIIGVEVDTDNFKGNCAPEISVEAGQNFDGDEIKEWESVIDKIEAGPHQQFFFVRDSGLTEKNYTHIRLRMYPDGGIARFRCYGKVVPTKAAEGAIIDTAAVGNGGVAIDCSDQHFSPASNILLPGRGVNMGDGWETARSRGDHYDWVIVRLGTETDIKKVVVDTMHFRGNFPQKINIKAINTKDESNLTDKSAGWTEIVPDSPTGADKELEYPIEGGKKYTHVMLWMIPDGGIKRFRVFGIPTSA